MDIGTGVSGLSQSTLPRRQRYGSNTGVFNVNLFNPRLRAGSDSKSIFSLLILSISIHAPAQAAIVLSYLWKSFR